MSELTIQTLVPRVKDAYAAFPTFVTHSDKIFMYFRRGATARGTAHGRRGGVFCRIFEQQSFLSAFGQDHLAGVAVPEQLVFAEGNEFDAIVSHLGPQRYALATRNYDQNKTMRTWISLASEPVFSSRQLVCLDELDWLAFYGKGMAWENRYIFTAYGSLCGEIWGRPLILACDDDLNWELLAALPSYWDQKTVLNESTLVRACQTFHLFMRQDTQPFGLWHATSDDLRQWTWPERLCEQAQAPMAFALKNRILVGHRKILGEDRATAALWAPFEAGEPVCIEPYEGNIYDGGYCDLGEIGGELFVFYYQGNPEREPFIRACRVKLPHQA